MPIRSFDGSSPSLLSLKINHLIVVVFANEHSLISHESLSHLNDLRIGVDAACWLRRILYQSAKEPCVMAMGGLPLSFERALEQELQLFKQYNIHLVVVFNGIMPLRKERPFSSEDRRPISRQAGWDAFARDRMDNAMSSWSSAGTVAQADLHALAFKILRKHQVEFIRSPYAPLAQLAYFDRSNQGFVHAVYASNDYLLYDVDYLITYIDFQRKTFGMLNKSKVLAAARISPDQFMDASLLAGFEYINTFAPLLESTISTGFNFQAALDMVRTHGNGFKAIQSYATHPSVAKAGYLDLFCRTRCMVNNHLVLNDNGQIQPLNVDQAPNDLHELIGPRLPEDYYFYLMQGLMSPTVLNFLTAGVTAIPAPLCNGDNVELQKFIKCKELTAMYQVALDLIRGPLHDHLKNKLISFVYWFAPTQEVVFQPFSAVQGAFWQWQVPQDLAASLPKSAKAEFGVCLNLLANPSFARKTVNPKAAAVSIQVSVSIFDCIDLMYIIGSKCRRFSSIGKVFASSWLGGA